MTTKQIPLSINGNRFIYSDFGARLGAMLLDVLILCPVAIPMFILNSQSITMHYYTLVFNLAFVIFYMVYLPKRYGGTPGKLITGLKIVKIDGLDIGWKEAFLRYSVTFGMTIINALLTLWALTQADAETYNEMSWLYQTQYLQSFSPVLHPVLMSINVAWFFAEIIVYFTSDRGRAVHDMLGNTVVIKKQFDAQVKEFMAQASEEGIESTSIDKAQTA